MSEKRQRKTAATKMPALRVHRQTPCQGVAADLRVSGRTMAYDMVCRRCGLDTTVIVRAKPEKKRDRLLCFLESMLATLPYHVQHKCSTLPVPSWFGEDGGECP